MTACVVRWCVGMIVGTIIIAITSPMFVRSYLPRQSNRGVWTLPAGGDYRWRSEGYATTAIGPHGMPGKTIVRTAGDAKPVDGRRVALWGDSQVEGVCVNDDEKIFALVERDRTRPIDVFPLAQSGDDLGDWMRQLAWAEQNLSVTHHVFVIVELSDLRAGNDVTPPVGPSDWSQFAATHLPAFVVASIRNLTTTADGNPRRLRFSLGPVTARRSDSPINSSPINSSKIKPSRDRSPKDLASGWERDLTRLRAMTSMPIAIIHAPKLPEIIGDEIRIDDGDDAAMRSIRPICDMLGIDLVSVRAALIDAGRRGDWPHGFDNGRIGSGHLNATGNAIVADAVTEWLR